MTRHTARIINVRDASTFDIEYDLGFDVKVTCLTHLLDPDTNERMYTRDKAYGERFAKQFVRDWLFAYPTVSVEVVERRNGTAYAYLYGGDEQLNQLLVDKGYRLDDPSKRPSKVSLYEREDIEPQGLYPLEYDEDSTIEGIPLNRKFFPLS